MPATSSIPLGILLSAAIFLPGAPIWAQVVEHPAPGDSAAQAKHATIYQGSRNMRDLGKGSMVVTPTSFASLENASNAPLTILPALDSPALRLAVMAHSQESGAVVQIPPPVFPPEPSDPNASDVPTASDGRSVYPPPLLAPLGPAVRIQGLRSRDYHWQGWPWTPIFGSLDYYPPAWLACQDRHRRGWRSHGYWLW